VICPTGQFVAEISMRRVLAKVRVQGTSWTHSGFHEPGVGAAVRRIANAEKLKASIPSHHPCAEGVSRVAAMANVKTLVLNHFVPAGDNNVAPEVWMNAARTTFGGNIVVGKDLLQLPL
jgi:hypothetical protein